MPVETIRFLATKKGSNLVPNLNLDSNWLLYSVSISNFVANFVAVVFAITTVQQNYWCASET